MTTLQRGRNTVLVISDTQAPFHHPDTLPFLRAVKRRYKPNRIVHIGDVTDSYHLSDYIHDPEAISASEEIALMQEFVKKLTRLFPKVDVLTSNHDRRIYRKAQQAGIHVHFLKNYHGWMGCPSTWRFHDTLEIDNILYTHGDEMGAGGVNAARVRTQAYGQSTVSGHLHTLAEIRYLANRKTLLFGFQVGCLIDHKELAFAYSRKTIKKAIVGCGIVKRGIPTFIPMVLKPNGRWVGRL